MPSFEEIMQMAEQTRVELQKAQDKLDSVEVEGVSGGGLVKVRATAKGRILGLEIDDSLMQVSEKPMLEDLIAADDEIDARSIDLEERCFEILALQAPVAVDLRASSPH